MSPSASGMLRARVTVLFLVAVASSSLPLPAEEKSTLVTLTQCIDAALSGGPGLALSRTNLAISQSQYDQAVAQNALALSAGAGASHTQPILTPGGVLSYSVFNPGFLDTSASDTATASVSLANGSTNPATSVSMSTNYRFSDNTSSVSLTANQTLWDGYAGGRALATVQQAGITFQGKKVTAESDRKSVISSVKQAYYTVLADQRQLDILRQTLSQRQAEQERTQTLFSRHDATVIDVQTAEVNLTTADLDLSQGESTLEVDREKLSNLIGWPADREYTVAEVEDLEVPSLEVGPAVQKALQQRADLSQLQLNRSSGDITLAVRRSQFSPTVEATGGLSWRQDWTASRIFASWNAGLQVNVPLLDAGYLQQQVREAELQNRAYDIQAGQLAASIAADVKAALFSLRNLLARVKLAEASVRLSESNYELYLTQFEQGVSTNLDVLTASVGLATARVTLAKARADAQLGILALQTAMGE